MSLLDEIKKKSLYAYVELEEGHVNIVKLSDIEKVLGEWKCSNCKHLTTQKLYRSAFPDCKQDVNIGHLSQMNDLEDFFCSLFERRA